MEHNALSARESTSTPNEHESLAPKAFAPIGRIRVAAFVLLDLPVCFRRGEPDGVGVPDFVRGREFHT